ncbi:MAG: GLPGLI family protein [Bacteroidota bacterium]
MKHLILCVLFSLSMNLLKAQTQKVDYSIFYNFTYITDTTQNTYSNAEQYILFKHQNTSRFLNANAHHNDSLEYVLLDKFRYMADKEKSANAYMQAVGKEKKKRISDLRLLKDFEKGQAKIVLYNSHRVKCLMTSLQLKWNLENETKKISGLNCLKATTTYGGRDYIAWYTTEIPITDGPYVFNGLPGLIIKVVDSQKWYKFELISMNLAPSMRYIHPEFIREKYLQQINRKTYVAYSTAEKDDPKSPFGLSTLTGEQIIRMKEIFSKRFDLILEQ